MAEKLTLVVADQTVIPATEYSIIALSLNMGAILHPHGAAARDPLAANVNVTLLGQNNQFRYITLAAGQEAVDMIKALNKANLTIKSLERRILEKVIAYDAKYDGNITGAPD